MSCMNSKTTYVSQFDEVMNSLETRLGKLLEGAGGENTGLLNQLISELESEKIKGYRKDVDIMLEQVHRGFLSRLVARYPALSPTEVRVCSFLRLNITSRDIATLTHRSIRTVENTRNNIRAKMKINPEVNLVSHLLGI